ncbi:MAG TPA: type VI secretion system protein TssA [Thermoanaerobaculia bacterium]|jgi:type VI secretion system protein ImpA|nr:type VI secretion system protein TssA [Thermoanaerobaculia bacterium]
MTADPLLLPISEDRPAGESLRFDPVYDEIKRLREQDDPTLPQGVWQRELKKADWKAVASLCSDTLATRTKDLQVAAWLTEAWTHLEGFPGFERGVRLMTSLCRDFWPQLHPPLDEDGIESRIAPVLWIADRLVLTLKRVPVTAPSSEDALPYGWSAWESGLFLAKQTTADPKAEERGLVPQPKFLVSVSLTPTGWFVALAREVGGAAEALAELDAVLVERCGTSAAPSLTPLRAPLAAVQQFISRILDERRGAGELVPTAEGEVPMTQLEIAAGSEAPPPALGGSISTRADAYQHLALAADFLLRTEPHSPVPYLIKRAISWGNLSLAELLAELLSRNADLPTIQALLGMKK